MGKERSMDVGGERTTTDSPARTPSVPGNVTVEQPDPADLPAPPGLLAGAAAGALVMVGFTVIHGVFIVDIWDMLRPMVFSGAICGLCLVWSYRAASPSHDTQRWLQYIAACTGLLIVMGGVSLLTLESRFTMAELSVADDAMAQLVPPALPLMGITAAVGTIGLWWWSGRRGRALLPLLLTQVLVVFLAGHQLAFLGLVEMSAEIWRFFAEFAALTIFLGGGYAAAVRLLGVLRR